MTQQYEYLFTPLKVGSMIMPNRILFGPHGTRAYKEDEAPPDNVIKYYEARAKGGAGCIDVSGLNVAPTSKFGRLPAIKDPTKMDSFKKLTDTIHKHGTKVIVQLRDHTRHSSQLYGGWQKGPSPVYYHFGSRKFPRPTRTPHELLPMKTEIPHELDLDEIQEYIDAFGEVAGLMKQAGFDGIDLNSWCMNLNALFLSQMSNTRDDQYGGSLENRMRFNDEVIQAIRSAVGNDFTVGMSIDGDQMVDGGINLDEMKGIAQKLESTGPIDFFRVGIPPFSSLCMNYPLGSMVYLAAGIKEAVKVPVIAICRINDPIQADKILSDGHADIILMTRGLICDPELPKKAREGRLEEIRRCIACNERCRSKPYPPALPVRCALNAEASRETTFEIKPATTKKNVMVIGGGGAGLEAARVAALRGHKVTLCEQGDELGGQLKIAAKAPGRGDFNEVRRYYTYQMGLLGVDVRLNTRADVDLVTRENPDAVVVATGSRPYVPEIPGSDQPNVVEVRDVLEDKVEVGQKVVIIAYEHHNHALSTADFLVDRGKQVEVLTGTLYAGAQMDLLTVHGVYTIILSKGVVLTPLTEVEEIRGNTVHAYNVLSNKDYIIDGVDTIVVSTLGMADDALYRSLKGKVKELHGIGHCMAPRMLADGILDAAIVGRQL